MMIENIELDADQVAELAQDMAADAALDASATLDANTEPVTPEPMPAASPVTSEVALGRAYGFRAIPDPSGRSVFFGKASWALFQDNGKWVLGQYTRVDPYTRAVLTRKNVFLPGSLESALYLLSSNVARELGTVMVCPKED
jgi:hypothetical protein